MNKTTIEQSAVTRCFHCNKCSSVCPARIDIPAMLEIYAWYSAEGQPILNELDQTDFAAQPEDCIECGACSAYCPQRIDLMNAIRKLAMQI